MRPLASTGDGRRHTTTVRFDGDLWGRLGDAADRLGVRRAELIRDAAREHLARLDQLDRLGELEQRVDGLAQAIALLSRAHRRARPTSTAVPFGVPIRGPIGVPTRSEHP